MKIYRYTDLPTEKIQLLCLRQLEDDQSIMERVNAIVNTVKVEGDSALLNYAAQFDRVTLQQLFIGKDEIERIAQTIPEDAKAAIDTAYQNIMTFHAAQANREEKIETMPGVTCWRETRAIERVGLYIPGGSAVLPSTFLMLGIPAVLAGCKEIIVCSPPQEDGKTNCYLAYCALKLGIEKIYLAGGAQAVAAMAYGTETIPKADKIFGPGNRYVTQAKQLIQAATMTAIDMPAGPSEVLVLADDSANPAFIASDLLAQAEHGADSQTILVATSNQIITETLEQIALQIQDLPRKEVTAKAIANSYAVLVDTLEQGMEFSNTYAPEHLILSTVHFQKLIPLISNAGSVFLGNLTPESAGDYASGTNHTLPTSGYAKAYSGVSLDSFVKKITFQHITPQGLQNIGSTVEVLATAEGLQAHKNAITIRLKSQD
ncbi:histidinol dehydrogenase [Pedobacter metabolipauper]|uniref:Histidinol dehydrogenase n=1 Tax=Pedobacter metabolipauper TaxID=425513 RepID=A0A4V3D102_9SPHI|nr:histidinol dehydrogenase [Pedobacter metabolipauper]TDQ08504.1 histidinol dehydrogenase [Pedobacter metabolipauper]